MLVIAEGSDVQDRDVQVLDFLTQLDAHHVSFYLVIHQNDIGLPAVDQF